MAPPPTARRDELSLRPPADGAGDPVQRRLEHWIIRNLQDEPDSAANDLWRSLLGDSAALRRTGDRRAKCEPRRIGWSRFRLTQRRGVTVLRLTDRGLTRDTHIHELTDDLLAVIAAGHVRILLDFTEVERLSSWVVGAVARAQRECSRAPGGVLKLCGLQPDLAEAFALAGLARRIEQFPDADAALKSAWPEPPALGLLPIPILTELIAGHEPGPEPSEVPTVSQHAAIAIEADADPTQIVAPPESGTAEVWLRIDGRACGRPVAVDGDRFVIGRDPDCQLRLGTPQVSRHHAAIEVHSDERFLRDLGSTNGTLLNGRPLHGTAARLQDGDRVQVGPVAMTVTIGTLGTRAAVEDLVAGWLGTRPADAAVPEASVAATEESSATEATLLRREVVGDVLVLTPRRSELDGSERVEELRVELRETFLAALPRRVVLNLDCVGHLSGAALGVLVAHGLKLEQAGGALRLAQPPPRVMMMLAQVRLPELIDCLPTLDDAILRAWSRPTEPPAPGP
jgi:anti-anti-sigma factor